MKLIVGIEPQQVPLDGSQAPMLQNLGPGTIYFDARADVAVGTGIELAVGDVYEFPDDLHNIGALFVVSTVADTDLRYMAVR